MLVKQFCQLQLGEKFYIPVNGILDSFSVSFVKIKALMWHGEVFNTYCIVSGYYYQIERNQEVWTDEV